MALYITEYARMGVDPRNGQPMPAPEEPPVTTQKVTASGTSAQSSAFNAKTRLVEISADEVVSILFGEDPTATTSSPRLASDVIKYVTIPEKGTWKVAVIQNT